MVAYFVFFDYNGCADEVDCRRAASFLLDNPMVIVYNYTVIGLSNFS